MEDSGDAMSKVKGKRLGNTSMSWFIGGIPAASISSLYILAISPIMDHELRGYIQRGYFKRELRYTYEQRTQTR